MKKKCYDDGGLTFAEMSDEDRAAAAREAIESINARQRPAEVEVEEKSEIVRNRPSKPAVKKESSVKIEAEKPARAERAPSSVKVEPITGPAPAASRQAAMPDVSARKAATAERIGKARSAIRTAMGMKSGGSVSSASKRADGCAIRGKTRGRVA